MKPNTLFKTDSKNENVKDISNALIELSEKIEKLSIGKVDYFSNALENTKSDLNIDALLEKMELIQGLESEAYRGLHNSLLYVEKLSQI